MLDLDFLFNVEYINNIDLDSSLISNKILTIFDLHPFYNSHIKSIVIDVKENDPKKAKDIVENMCKKLLANFVIENYKIIETQ